MVRRISLFAVVGLLTMLVLAACGDDDEGEEPTVTRIPATNVPQAPSPTTAAGSPAAGSPAASPSAGEPASPEASPESAPAGSPEAAATTASEVTIDLLDIRFDPAGVSIPANTDVTVRLVNSGAAPHSFDIDALDIHTGDVQSGASTTVTINAAPGEYEFYCAIPGHRQAGMVGTLIVQ